MSRKNSDLWNHFSDMGDFKATCLYCSSTLSIKGGNVGNLSRHMRLKHKGTPIYRDKPRTSPIAQNINLVKNEDMETFTENTIELNDIQNTITTEFFTSIDRIEVPGSKQLDQQLLTMIVKEYYPISIVEDTEFEKFINLLCPDYKLPSRKTISQSLLPQMFDSTKELVYNKLSDATAICITTDCWTSINNESFVAITAHWINSNTEFCSNLLSCDIFNERHTTDNLKKILTNAFDEWKINDNIVAVVSDNTDNIVSAIKSGGWPHLECFAHTLNLIVQRGLACINVISIIRKIVEFFRRSSYASAKLVQYQVQMGLPGLKLKRDIPKCWNSTFEMITRILKIKDAVVSALTIIGRRERIELLSSDEWDITTSAMDVLSLFNEITIEISGEKNISLSKEVLFIQAMQEKLLTFQKQELHKDVLLMIETLLKQIEERFKNVEDNEIIGESILLDPRFKKYGFSNMEKYDQAYSCLQMKLCLEEVDEKCEISHATSNERPSTSWLWEKFDEKVNKNFEQNSIAEGRTELDRYIDETLISRSCDPLVWWEQRKMIYPRLYSIMRKRLCIVATSIPCERFFSKTGQIITEKRSRLTSSKINQIIFLHNNLD